jgi:hypothetical protein
MQNFKKSLRAYPPMRARSEELILLSNFAPSTGNFR